MSVDGLRKHYPELAKLDLVPVDIVDDGESLQKLNAASQDFVIANHFLEHCQDPIGTIRNMLRVVGPGGVVYLAVPDKRFTFDIDREVTPLHHLIADYENGPEASRYGHYEEWVRQVGHLEGDAAKAEVERLMKMDYSIHFHVWNFSAFNAFLQEIQHRLGFSVELLMQNKFEVLTILRRNRE